MKPHKLALLLLIALLLAGCDTAVYQDARYALGPVKVTVTVRASDSDEAAEAIDAAFDAVTLANNLMSSYLTPSEVSRLNRDAGRLCHVSAQTEAVLHRAVEMGSLTDGAFDVTAGPLITLWKDTIETVHAFQDRTGQIERALMLASPAAGVAFRVSADAIEACLLPDETELAAARALVGYERLTVDANTATLASPGMSVDLGGIAKGFAVDKAVEALEAEGIEGALVDAGGDGYALGTKPGGKAWRIGIQIPDEATGAILDGVLVLSDVAYATSGDYQQYVDIAGVRYAHIVDPRTGQPARIAASVTVIAPDCATADALATGISVLGPKAGIELVEKLTGVECMIITREGGKHKIAISSGFAKYQD